MKKIENFIETILVLSILSALVLMIMLVADPNSLVIEILCGIFMAIFISSLVSWPFVDELDSQEGDSLQQGKVEKTEFQNFRLVVIVKILNFLILIVNFICLILVGVFVLLNRGTLRFLGIYVYGFFVFIAGLIDILRSISIFLRNFVFNKSPKTNKFLITSFVSKKILAIDLFLNQLTLSAIKNFVDKKPLKQF